MNSEIFPFIEEREKRQIADVERLQSEMEELENRLNKGDIDRKQFAIEIEVRLKVLEAGIAGLENIQAIKEMEHQEGQKRIARLELIKGLLAEEQSEANEELIRLREKARKAEIAETKAFNDLVEHFDKLGSSQS